VTLTPKQAIFLQRLVADRPTARREGKIAMYFVTHFAIGVRVGRMVEYCDADITAALNFLQNSGLPTIPLTEDMRRAQTSQFVGISEKTFSQAPHKDSVSLKVASGVCRVKERTLVTPAGCYGVFTVEQAMQVSADRIMVVENLETFRNLELQRWIDYGGLNVLAVYRGDSRFALTDVTKVIQERKESTWAFFDFDPAGLAMAATLQRLERIILPDFDWLEQETRRCKRSDLFAPQVNQYRNFLETAENKSVRAIWRRMSSLNLGFPQEWMEDAPFRAG